jgi:crossover junction endodeoxyribonuclease RusA
MQKLRLFVPGIPRPQGSKRHVGNGRMIEANPHLRDWRSTVTHAAREAMGECGLVTFMGPLKIQLLFELPKGKSVSRFSPSVKPDVDKLCRSIFDALEAAGCYANDSQIVELHATKTYGTTRQGVTILLDYF